MRTLPQDGWQIVPTVPWQHTAGNEWIGVNLTFYGPLTASASLLAIVLFLVLMAASGVSLSAA